MLVVAPAVLLPVTESDSQSIVALLACFAFIFALLEYLNGFPTLLSFRFAPPYNRLAYGAALVCVAGLALALHDPASLPGRIGTELGGLLDLPFSPVHLMTLAAPAGSAAPDLDMVRMLAGWSLLAGVLWLAVFALLLRLTGWPVRGGTFNVLINLPLFDPTAGGDVVTRLLRMRRINFVLAFVLPFVIPAVLKLTPVRAPLLDPAAPQGLIWVTALWALVPFHLVVRGLALGRVARLVADARARLTAEADPDDWQPA